MSLALSLDVLDRTGKDHLRRAIAAHPARTRVVVAGRRWGKTYLAAWCIAARVLRGQRGLWVAPSWQQCDEARRALRALLPEAEFRQTGLAPMTFRHPSTRGEIRLATAEHAYRLRGTWAHLLVVDEADYVRGDDYQQVLRPLVSDKRGRVLLLSTPSAQVSTSWVREIWDLGREPAPEAKGVASWRCPTWTAPWIDPAEIEAARRELPELVFRREYGAEFVEASGARLKREWIDRAKVEGKAGWPGCREGMGVGIGVDLAFSRKTNADWTAAAVVGRDRDGNTWVLDAERVHGGLEETVQLVDRLGGRWHPQHVAVEDWAAQRYAVETLSRQTKWAVSGMKPIGDKVARFTVLEAR